MRKSQIIYIVAILITISFFSCLFQPDYNNKWKLTGLENEKILSIALESDSCILYVGSSSDFSLGIEGKLFRSSDFGITWDTLLIGGKYKDIYIDQDKNIYTINGRQLLLSSDFGDSWSSLNSSINNIYNQSFYCMAINPLDPSILYLGGSNFGIGFLYKSKNAGQSWNIIGNDSLNRNIMYISINPKDTSQIYVSTDGIGRLWKSENSGETWSQTELLGHTTLIRDICIGNDSSDVFIGREKVYFSPDRGNSWEIIGDALPSDSRVIDIQYSVQHGLFIILDTHDGGGVYKFDFNKGNWTLIGIDGVDNYYYSTLRLSPDNNKIYFGSNNGLYELDYTFK